MIPVRPTPHVTAMAASDMATKGSESEGEKKEKKAISPEKSATNQLIETMDSWLEERTKEVEMIQSFLKRGFDWPSQKHLRPTSKRQRKRVTKWLEKNKERMQYARKEILAKGGWQYDHEHDYTPSPEQKEEWKQWLKHITRDTTSQKEYEKRQITIRGLIKNVLEGIDCQAVKRFIPKDHWVYITMRYWLEEQKEGNDQWAEAMRISIEYDKRRKVSMKEMDEILSKKYLIAMTGDEKMPIRPTKEEKTPIRPSKEEKTPIRPSGGKSSQNEEEIGQYGQNMITGDHPVGLHIILEESPVAGDESLAMDTINPVDKRPLKRREKDSHAMQIRATGCQSTQNQTAAKQPPTQRATKNIASIFRATSSHSTHSEHHTVPIHTVACKAPAAAKPAEEDTANQPMMIPPKLIDPLAFTRRHAHYPVTFEDALLNGQYECRYTTSPIKHYIDWETLTHGDGWTYSITQEIMENRATSMDDWETDAWANAIDDELKLACIDEDSEEWDITDKQAARITHHMRSAAHWFQHQPMQIRLHRLNTKGWLAEQIYLYAQGRVTWPWQMGPAPTTDIERRLIELWHNSNRNKMRTPPSAIQDYTTWWNDAQKREYDQQQLRVGNRLAAEATELAHNLGKLPAGSHAEQAVLHYITKGTPWPTSHLLKLPYSQLHQEVVTSWWANHRERLDRQWGSRYMSHDLNKAQALWRQCTMTTDASHDTTAKSRSNATQRTKPKRQRRQTQWKNIRHKELPCQTQ